MDQKKLEERMTEFQRIIKYRFADSLNLSRAMMAFRVRVNGEGKHHREYSNDAIATIGDAFLKTVLAQEIFESYARTKGQITEFKAPLENNQTMYDLMLKEGWTKYIFNEKCFYDDDEFKANEKPPFNKHVQYVEALIGGILLDSDYETTKIWILHTLLPLLQKYKHEPKPHN